jgi:hypothetical protein
VLLSSSVFYMYTQVVSLHRGESVVGPILTSTSISQKDNRSQMTSSEDSKKTAVIMSVRKKPFAPEDIVTPHT